MPRAVTVKSPIKKVVRGVPGPPGDLTQPFDYIQLNTASGDPASIAQGMMWWNADEECFNAQYNGQQLQIGLEWGFHVRNTSGALISNGTVVMVTGTIGASGRLSVSPWDGQKSTAHAVIGLTTYDLSNQTDGKVTSFGKVRGIDTSGLAEGDLWADPDNPGALTDVEPDASKAGLRMAFNLYQHATQGVYHVRVSGIDEHYQIGNINGLADALLAITNRLDALEGA